METKGNKNNILALFAIVFGLMIAPLTVSLLKTNLSVNGSARFYVLELVVFVLAVYVILWQLFIKRKLTEISNLSKLLLSLGIIFGVYYMASIAVRYFTHTLTFGSFFLARIVIESIVIFVVLDYFKISGKTILDALVITLLLATVWQYGILFLGSGFLRGANPVLTSTYVYVIYSNTVHVILAYNFMTTNSAKFKWVNVIIFLLNFPTILLTGSRVGVVTSALIIFIFIMTYGTNMKISKRITYILAIYLTMFLCFLGTIIIADGENKGIISRSISIPLSVVKMVTPDSIDDKIDELLTFKVDNKKIKDIKTEKKYLNSADYVDDTIEVSGNQRKEANSKAYQMIFKNPSNLIFGTGTGMIHRHGKIYQKPHNYFAQYTLSFGLVGFFLSLAIYLSPVIWSFKRGKRDGLLMVSMIFPIILNSFLQPALGTIVVLYVFIMLLYVFSISKFDENLKECKEQVMK